MNEKELLSDYRHVACHFREVYQKAFYASDLNKINGEYAVINEIVRLSKLAITNDEQSNLKRAMTSYISVSR